jgi:Plasma-membrane choline transporter
VYVGFYGFSFLEAGENVTNLFRSRGWTSIINDIKVNMVLHMLSLTVGILTALICVFAMYFIDNDAFTHGYISWLLILIVALLPMFMGYMVAITVFFSTVGSAANAIIVCYAEAPHELQTNHPILSERVTNEWNKEYPNHFDY